VSRVLEIKDLTVRIDMRHSAIHPVDGVSLYVDAGETVGIVGESGCGKSMTGLSIMQLLPPGGHITNGRIELMGRDLAPLNYSAMHEIRGNEVAMVFQDPMTSLNPTKSIGDQVAEPVRIHQGASHRVALDRAVEVLDLVGLPRPKERLDDYPHQLSGGMRQRVMIAMALACEPQTTSARPGPRGRPGAASFSELQPAVRLGPDVYHPGNGGVEVQPGRRRRRHQSHPGTL
jgi:peptide/nickel transport system ATP-binding protein